MECRAEFLGKRRALERHEGHTALATMVREVYWRHLMIEKAV